MIPSRFGCVGLVADKSIQLAALVWIQARPRLAFEHGDGRQLTEGDPGFDAGNLGVGDVLLDKRRLAGLFQQVPHLDSAVLFSNVEDGRSGRGPACRRAHLLRVW